MHKFGTWYFQWCWLLVTVFATVVVFFAPRTKHPKPWRAVGLGVPVLIGGIAFYWKWR